MSGNTSIMEPSADLKNLDESSKVDYKEGEATLFDQEESEEDDLETVIDQAFNEGQCLEDVKSGDQPKENRSAAISSKNILENFVPEDGGSPKHT